MKLEVMTTITDVKNQKKINNVKNMKKIFLKH